MFTSRLPVSTSVRRPTSHADGSTSFVGLDRPSNIPVTVRKANLFTPQTNKRPFQGGMSTAGKSYMSGMTTEKKFQQRTLKPVPDRELQLKMFDTLVDFMKNHAPHLPQPEAKKFFSSISTTESINIFEFLISRILPDFKINRLETDVPEALACLDYPYIRSVTKSALVSVTTRQAAVGLLVIFNWLIGSIKKTEGPDPDESGDEEYSTGERNVICSNISTQPDRVSEANRKAFDQLYPSENMHKKMSELEKITTQIDDLIQYLEEKDELIETGQTLDEDIAKCRNYFDQMKMYRNTKTSEYDEIMQKSLALDIQKEDRGRRKERLLIEIKNHELSLDEVKRKQEIIDELESKHTKLRGQADEANMQKEQVENSFQRLLDRLRERSEVTINLFKKLLHEYDSQGDLESEHLANRKKELREWEIRLEQISTGDLVENEKLQHQLSRFMQKLEATNLSLETEIRANIMEQKSQLESLELSNDKDRREEIVRLKEALVRVQRETENERVQYMNNLSKTETRREEENSFFVQLREKYEEQVSQFRKDIEVVRQRLKSDRDELVERKELNIKHLRIVLEGLHQSALGLVKDDVRVAERWEQVRKISEENNRVVKGARKILKRRLAI